ncbi:MAG: nucleotide exchange factor GrpE [Candidatus Eisenbacteria bacterium]
MDGKDDKNTEQEKYRHKHSKKDLENEIEALSGKLESVKKELQETKDQLLRGLADFDNYRKRIAREREHMTKCANEELIRRLLEVVDNVELALEAASDAKDFEGFRQGIEMIYKRMSEILSKEGLCPIICLGEDFDPNYHEAVMAIDAEGKESEKVVEEMQKGYTLDGRVIRPSKVVVSK